MPTVSVVIPVYNAQDVIGETLRSVQRQTWRDYEIVVVDDGSSDNSAGVIRRADAPITYLRQVNAGVASARNRGIAAATGRYIALLDHDDVWREDKLERQVAVLEQQPDVGMVITDVAHITRDGRPLAIPGRGYNAADTFARLFVSGYVPTPSAAMIRRTVFECVGGFDERFGSAGLDDHELWTRIAARYPIVNIGEPLTIHRNREVKAPDIALEHRTILIEMLLSRFAHDPERRRYLLRERASGLADLGRHLIRQGHRREGRRRLLQGLALSLGPAHSVKTAWRCVSRLGRSWI